MKRAWMRSQLAAWLSTLVLTSSAHAAILYSDDFDLPTGLNYTLNADADSRVTFAYDYNNDGIPAAPHSALGTTFGVKFEANIVDPGAVQALNISPTGKSFTGDFVLRFDMWINANGPFPDGGTGSTEFITAGVGTAGFSIQKSSGNADGTWFAVDGEGQSSIDYRAHRGITVEGANSTVYAAPINGSIGSRNADNPYYQTAFPGGQGAPQLQQILYPAQNGTLKPGTVGFAWRDVAISKIGTDVTWSIDGLTIATVPNATISADNIFVDYWDVFPSVSDNPATSFGLIDNLRVESVPEPSSTAALLAGCAAVCGRRRRRANS
jgi:hypothetical protein